MEKFILIACFLAITVYMTVTAWEDYKSCEVTRWKHLIGGIPAILLYFVNFSQRSWEENAIIASFSIVYIVIGYVGVYGFADGLVLAILTMFFGSVGGVVGSGAVLCIVIIASFSFLFCHVVKSIVKKKKVFCDMVGAFIPHILIGYGSVSAAILAGMFA